MTSLGFPREDVEKIIGGNMMKLFKVSQPVAA
jgi:hypothetical protein